MLFRSTAGGVASAHVFEALQAGDAVRVEGPSGTAYLREHHRGPIIAVAGGSGLAPIRAIVERALNEKLPQHLYLYFGVRSERDLYLHDHFARLAERHPEIAALFARGPRAVGAAALVSAGVPATVKQYDMEHDSSEAEFADVLQVQRFTT